VKVDEADVAKLKVGQTVNITADALQRRTFTGKVHRIAPQGTIENNVTVFQVLVAVGPRGSEALRPQMSANIEVVVTERAPAVLVPARAVKRRGRRVGQVTLASGAVARVKLGISVDGQTEILSGLKAGQRVQIPVRKRAAAAKGQRGNRRGNSRRNMRRMMGGRR
jgi:HlyD family secretion protein